jgi:hypothetical protein
MIKPTAVVVGFIGKLPFAGMSLYNLHYIAGLHDLGYRVHYVELNTRPGELYDPVADTMTDDPAHAIAYLRQLLPRFGISHGEFSFVDRGNNCNCTSWNELRAAIREMTFTISLTKTQGDISNGVSMGTFLMVLDNHDVSRCRNAWRQSMLHDDCLRQISEKK